MHILRLFALSLNFSPIKIVFFQLLRFAPDLLPVGRCACECDAREPAATTHAVGEVQRSIGIKAEDKLLDDKIANETEYFGTHENYELSHNRHRTPMNSSLWNDYTSPTTTEEIDLTMTGEEKDDFYSKLSKMQNLS